MYTLRAYQQEAVDKSLEYLRRPVKKPTNGVLILPTGAGKSLVVASLIDQLDGQCMVFQPGKEILEQNFAKLVAYGYKPAIYSASMGRKQIGEITLATIGSVKKVDDFRDLKYVIVDECDLVDAKGGMYAAFFREVKDARIIGLSATPYRLVTDAYGGSMLKFITRTRPRVFTDVVYHVDTGPLFDQGYLARLEYHSIKGFDRSKLDANTTGADYTDLSVQRHFKQIAFKEKVIRVVDRLLEIGRKHILVFTRFVEESQYLADRIQGAAIVTGETPKGQREEILSDFQKGRIKVVANVGVLTRGYDFPELDAVVLARPTMSLPLYYQMIGRGVRPHPDKEKTMIVDMVEVCKQFGKIEDLVLRRLGKKGEKWAVFSGHRPLTNVYYGEKPQWNRRRR